MFFEGEIYNKKELGLEGSDAEAVAAAYAKWGLDSFAKLRGAFAFAIQDGSKTILVRDQFGTFPFYYYVGNVPHGIVYGTSVKGLLEKGVPRKLSKPGLGTYLAFGALQHPWTLIEGVYGVPPASYLVYDAIDKSVKITEYWIPSFKMKDWEPGELNEAIVEALQQSVQRQVEYGDDPAAFLSGGLDSSAITIFMRKLNPEREVRTYCITTENPLYDERKWAKMVADRNHTKHTEIMLTGNMIRRYLDDAVASYDQPSVDGINFWFASKLVKEAGEKVIFSGAGGDELFLGKSQMYKPLLAYKYDPYFRWMPRAFGRLVEKYAPQEKFRKLGQLMGRMAPPYHIAWRIFSEDRIMEMLNPDLVDFSAIRNPVDDSEGIPMDIYNFVSWMELRNVDIDMYLRDGFQTSAAHRLGMRTPILDVKLAEILYTVPGKPKYDPLVPKPHLIRACGDGLPPECATRKKMGFSLPFKDYFHGTLKDKVESFLLAGDTKLFKSEIIRKLGKQFYAGKVYWSNVWIPFMAENWCRLNKIEL